MFNVIEATVKPLMLNTKILEVAYELYLEAPETYNPTIDLRTLSRKTNAGLLECRNAIVEANRCGRFPDCSLEY